MFFFIAVKLLLTLSLIAMSYSSMCAKLHGVMQLVFLSVCSFIYYIQLLKQPKTCTIALQLLLIVVSIQPHFVQLVEGEWSYWWRSKTPFTCPKDYTPCQKREGKTILIGRPHNTKLSGEYTGDVGRGGLSTGGQVLFPL